MNNPTWLDRRQPYDVNLSPSKMEALLSNAAKASSNLNDAARSVRDNKAKGK